MKAGFTEWNHGRGGPLRRPPGGRARGRARQPLPGHALRRRLARGLRGHGPRGLDRPALARAPRRRAGGPARRRVAAEERFGWHWLPLSGYLLSVKTIGNALLGHASDELQERLLPEIAAGRLVFCQGFSEPEAGSDLASLRTSARRDGERFVVSGHKIWTSSAQIADWIYLAVRTDPDAARPHRGVSVLVADMRTPGIEVREIETVGGGVLCEVFLDDVEVPGDQLVGELHGGWRVLMGTLDHERVTSEKVGRGAARARRPRGRGTVRAERLELRRLRGEAQAARLLGRAGRRAARRGPARGGGLVDGEALDRVAGAPHGRAGHAPARPGRAVEARAGGGPRGRAHARERRQHGRRRGGRDPAPGDRAAGPRVRGVSACSSAAAEEARQFAETVAAVAARHAAPDPWRPGAAERCRSRRSMRPSRRRAATSSAPTSGCLRSPHLPARRSAAALPRSPRSTGCSAGRSGAATSPATRATARRSRSRAPAGSSSPRAERVTPVPYTDALGAWRAWSERAADGRRAEAAALAWPRGPPPPPAIWPGWPRSRCALALEHAARGAPSAAAGGARAGPADARRRRHARRRARAARRPTCRAPDALAHAGEAAERAVANCMQVTGALGFTLEFPLQRAYRRSPRRAGLGRCGAASPGRAGVTLPLDGLRVLDYGQYVAAPFATMLLADLGADVVKVEPPRGDEWRRYDPFEEGESRYFYALNRGKRSVALDLRTERGAPPAAS